ncbi:MAG: AAA family ATPase [Gammaproteobacteria bacterium]|nr:AAA family ATPase [Gammaproteobacteria bacterium]
MSASHREALAHLLYGIRSDSGFVLLTGEVGTGKTTVCRCLLEQLPENTKVAFILNPRVTVKELLSSICDELGIAYRGHDDSVKTFVDAINRHLLMRHADGCNTVVIIDEAQNLSFDVLEQLRLLTNLETNERKLLRIILLGQPELGEMLARPEFKQLEQRITARYHLRPLQRSEVGAYVSHRLAVAGRRKPVFSEQVLAKLYRKTRGIPRLINVICDRAMLGAYVKSKRRVSGSILGKAASEVQGRSHQPGWSLRGALVGFSLLIGAAATAALFYANDLEIAMILPRTPAEPSPGVAGESPVATDMKGSPAEAIVEGSGVSSPAMPKWPQQAVARDDSSAAANVAQFKQWNIPLALDHADPCAQAVTRGLRCYSGVGNLGTLASYDRPAILTLVDNEGRRYQATLLALNDEMATLAFAHGIETVTVADLEVRWQGRYQLLWRAAPRGITLIRPGSRGPGVTWLTRNLRAAGIESLPVKNEYDAEVVAAVRAFQRERGLVADGIAGRQTLIHLNSRTDDSIPRLGKRRDS